MKLNNLSDLDDELFNEIAQSFDTPNLIRAIGNGEKLYCGGTGFRSATARGVYGLTAEYSLYPT